MTASTHAADSKIVPGFAGLYYPEHHPASRCFHEVFQQNFRTGETGGRLHAGPMTTSSAAIGASFLAAAVVAVASAAGDARTHRLRDRNSGLLALIAVTGAGIAIAAGHEPPRWRDVALGPAIFAGPWLAAHLISPAAVGFGDVKLAAALGLYLGWLGPATAAGALLAASALFLAVSSIRRTPSAQLVPFGPALVAGAVAASGVSLLLAAAGP
jgi:prepilin signal peptidase PulO-like enzyme (type II secretory pathway)